MAAKQTVAPDIIPAQTVGQVPARLTCLSHETNIRQCGLAVKCWCGVELTIRVTLIRMTAGGTILLQTAGHLSAPAIRPPPDWSTLQYGLVLK